ncbi:MAG: hypothetical protein R3257_00255 [bacterium]|nr:hypothetical protein [bacterium]
MTPPTRVSPHNQNCAEEIREVELPFDECSEPVENWLPAHQRYRRLSLHLDGQWGHQLAPHPEFSSFGRMGVGAIFRPFNYTPVGVFGFGATLDLNFQNDLVALARVQTSFNIQRHARERLTFALQGGIRHMFGRPMITEGTTDPQGVTGTLGVVGAELALESRLFRYLTLIPFLGVQYTIPGSVDGDRDGSGLSLESQVDFILGGRISFDVLPVGEADYL